MSYAAETNDGEVTQYIPLTSVWTASSGCKSSFRQDGPSLMAFDPGYGLEIDTTVICQPPAVTTWWNQGLLGGGSADNTRVSLMPMTCPASWSTVVTSVKDKSSTLAMCCPSGYYLANGVSEIVMGDCLSDITSGIALTYAWTSTATNDWRIGTTTMTSSSTVGAIAVIGWNVKRAVATSTSTSKTTSMSTLSSSSSSSSTPSSSTPASLETTQDVLVSVEAVVSSTSSADATSSASDMELSSNIASSPGPRTSSSIGASSSPSTASSFQPTQSTSPSTMSTELKVGIGLGVSLGVIGVIALLFATIMLWRRKRPETKGKGDRTADHGPPVAELKQTPILDYSKHRHHFQAYELPTEHFGVPELAPENFDPVEMGSGRKSRGRGL